jgi:fructosamine-3-kinase
MNVNTLINKICETEGLKYISTSVISGGDINATYQLVTDEGRFFMKLNSAVEFPEMFEKEADGLKALQQVKLLKVPEIVATGKVEDKQYLLLELLEKQPPSPTFWETFAQGLASLHWITNSSFGWHTSNYIGSLAQENNYKAAWAEFYATQRITPLVQKLFDKGALSKVDVSNAEILCSRLTDIFPIEPPALLHGDLWGGNFMPTKLSSNFMDAVPSIFDPAVYYGHREMDIGMSLLFGGFDSSFYEAYHSFYPLEKNWRQRISLTQLYPLLVHAILFRGSYISQCKSILNDWK